MDIDDAVWKFLRAKGKGKRKPNAFKGSKGSKEKGKYFKGSKGKGGNFQAKGFKQGFNNFKGKDNQSLKEKAIINLADIASDLTTDLIIVCGLALIRKEASLNRATLPLSWLRSVAAIGIATGGLLTGGLEIKTGLKEKIGLKKIGLKKIGLNKVGLPPTTTSTVKIPQHLNKLRSQICQCRQRLSKQF